MIKRITLILIYIACNAGSYAHADDKALLIGTGVYKNANYNLTGIDLDIQTITNFARSIGYQTDKIKTLLNEQVTKENIQSAFSGFLSEGVDENDSILIYYSGHGVQVEDQNNDELDGRDEALTLHTLDVIEGGYSGILADDELSTLLKSLPSENITMIVDACHSGTVTRGITEVRSLQSKAYGPTQFQAKALPYRGPRRLSRSIAQKDVTIDSSTPGVVTLSAAQDDEQALATTRGSTFTLALSEALQLWGSNASISSLMRTATDIIYQRVDQQHVFRPNLTGDKDRFEKSVRVDGGDGSQSVNWLDAATMVSRFKFLEARLDKLTYLQDDTINLTLEIPSNGYLNVLGVDGDDALVLLYPNRFDADNYVTQGTLSLPGPHSFEWIAQAPWGNNLIVAILSTENVNLYKTSLQKNLRGESTSDYVLPDASTLFSLGFGTDSIPPQDTHGVALEFNTCQTNLQCP